MPYVVDFENVSTVGLETSPVADALAGLRANEARYFRNKYDHTFTVGTAAEEAEAVERVARVLKEERDIVIASPALEATRFEVEGIDWTYVFYESGLSINLLYTVGGRRASGPSASSSPTGWKCRRSSPPSNSPARSRGSRAPSAGPTSSSRASTDAIATNPATSEVSSSRTPAAPSGESFSTLMP